MDLLQLRYFQVVAQHEHMTRAAAELGIAQPSLSQTIARLEEELGVPLFDRQGRQIQLNQFGRAFLPHVQRIFAELDDAKHELASLSGLEQGRIALSIFGTPLLPDLLSAFLAEHPRVTFRLSLQRTSQELQQQLEHGEIDLCITTPPIDRPGIACIPLITEEIYLLVPDNHRLAQFETIHLREAAHESFVGLEPGAFMRDLTDGFCHAAGFTQNVAFEADEPSLIRGFVGAGLGIGFMPGLTWPYYQFEQKNVRRIRIAEPRCERTIALAWRESRYLSRAAQAFREFVVSYFKTHYR